MSSVPPASFSITPVIAVIGRITPRPMPSSPAPMMRNTTPEMIHRMMVKVATRWVAPASKAALASLVFLTMSSMTARWWSPGGETQRIMKTASLQRPDHGGAAGGGLHEAVAAHVRQLRQQAADVGGLEGEVDVLGDLVVRVFASLVTTIPTTWPAASITGPPLLPDCMGMETWISRTSSVR